MTTTLRGLAALCACFLGCAPVEETAVVGDAIIDGKPVPENEYQAAVFISAVGSACTGAKVGPRQVLTAAHCVEGASSQELAAGFQSGQKILLIYANEIANRGERQVEIEVEQTWIHPRYTGTHHGGIDTPDVALIVAKEWIPYIPSGYIDSRSVEDSNLITIMGYGYESSSAAWDLPWAGDQPPGRLMAADTVAKVPAVALVSRTTHFATDSWFGAAIAPGDSGGPVFRGDGIVGVNCCSKIGSDWYTRLSNEGDFGVASWLKNLGANVDDPTLSSDVPQCAPNQTLGSAPGSEPIESTPCGDLHPGEKLPRGAARRSCDGRFELVMQDDGNLVLYQIGVGPLWGTATDGTNAEHAIMQSDGNLVVYAPQGVPLWGSGTQGYPCSRLVVQDDGNLVIYAGNAPLWSSNTCCR